LARIVGRCGRGWRSLLVLKEHGISLDRRRKSYQSKAKNNGQGSFTKGHIHLNNLFTTLQICILLRQL